MIDTTFKHIENHWFVLAHSKDIHSGKPTAIKVLNKDLVAYRDGKAIVVFDDECPHRRAPLSKGKVKDGCITCPYHGWKFNKDGVCTNIPGLINQKKLNTQLSSYQTFEANNIVFINFSTDLVASNPHIAEHVKSEQHVTYYYGIDIGCNYIDLAENFLDPFHTPILHPGLIRSDQKRSKNKVNLKRIDSGFEFHYDKLKKQSGAFSFLGPNVLKDLGRFILPSTVDLEFISAKGLEFANSMYLTPKSESSCRAHFYVSIKNNLLYRAWFKLFGGLVLKRVVKQDKAILELQSKILQKYDEPSFIYSQSDFSRKFIEDITVDKDAKLVFKEIEVLL